MISIEGAANEPITRGLSSSLDYNFFVTEIVRFFAYTNRLHLSLTHSQHSLPNFIALQLAYEMSGFQIRRADELNTVNVFNEELTAFQVFSFVLPANLAIATLWIREYDSPTSQTPTSRLLV